MKSIGMLIGLSFVFTSCIQVRPAYADHSRHPVVVTHIDHSPDQRHRKKVKVKKIVIGTRVKARSVNCIVIRHNQIALLYAAGVFYRQINDGEYEVVRPEIGMVVPELPAYDVEHVKIKGKTLFLYDGTLYKQIPTTNGIQYEVYGFIDE